MPISECFFLLCIFMKNVDICFFKHIDSLFYLIELIYWCIKKDYFVFPLFSKIYFKCKIKWAHRQTIHCVSFRSSWGCSYSSTGKQLILYLHKSISFLLNHFPFKRLSCKLYRYLHRGSISSVASVPDCRAGSLHSMTVLVGRAK